MNSSDERRSRGLRAACFVTLATLAGVDSAISLLAGWRPTAAPRQLAWATIFAALLVIGAALVPTARRGLASRRLLLATSTTAITLLLVETAARFIPALGAAPYEHTRGPNVRRRFLPDAALYPGISGPSMYSTNGLGFRGSLPTADTRHSILAIGASTTEGTYLDDSENWPARLEARLNQLAARPRWFAVSSAGMSGYTTLEHLDYLERSPIPWRFDTRIITVGINDMLKAASGSLEIGRPPLWRRSRLLRVLLAANRSRQQASKQWLEEDQTGTNMIGRRNARSVASVISTAPDLQRQLAEYRERLTLILELCAMRGKPCIVVSQPVAWDENLESPHRERLWMGRTPDGAYYHPAVLRRLMDSYVAVTREVAKSFSVPFATLETMNGRPEYFVDDCHLNETGADRVAEELVRQTGLVR
jgi:lysophospholipase L1-like esterase